MNEYGNIVIYKDKNGNDNIEVKMKDNTVWLNQEQLVKLYNSSKSNISEHIKHIFEEGELDDMSTVRKFRTVASNGKSYNMNYYNLDMILAVGYRVNSDRGIMFRRWANSILKQYLLKGHIINEHRCMSHSDNLIQMNNAINNINDRLSNVEIKLDNRSQEGNKEK